jgi:hypothetical protein
MAGIRTSVKRHAVAAGRNYPHAGCVSLRTPKKNHFFNTELPIGRYFY